jgi:anti-sigma28 factor (negative regulator of flagellin synthesis)
MKVPGSGGNDSTSRKVQDELAGEQAAVRRNAARSMPSAADVAVNRSAKADTDSVRVSAIGAFFREELDPVKMAEERRQKIAMLKEQIKNGTYSPPTESVARAISEELSLEVAFGGVDNQ